MSKVLIHTIVFSPDGVSTAYLYNDIALRLRDEGHQVVVLTTTPHYNVVESALEKQPLRRHALGLWYTSDFHGIRVMHVPQKKFRSALLRLAGFMWWHMLSLALGMREKGVDVILSPSPPLTIGVINIALGRMKGARVIYNVQEIYPDLLISGGGLRSRPVIAALRRMERFVYDYSDAVTTIDDVFRDTIAGRFRDPSKLHVIPNFVDTELYKPLEPSECTLDRTLFPDTDSLKVVYAGNIGHAQDWRPLIEAARELKDENIDFFVVGEGVMRDEVARQIEAHGLRRIHLIPYQPREVMPSLIAYSDLQFIFMSPLTEGHGFPSKVYTVMACARPLLVCSGEGTPIVEFLCDKGCAWLVTEGDLKARTTRIVHLLRTADRDELRRMGRRGVEHIELHYTKEAVTAQYLNLLS